MRRSCMERKNFFVYSFGAILIAGAMWFFISDGDARIDIPQRGEAIIAFGDSLIEGVGASAGNDFVSILSSRLQTPIIGAGVSGDTTVSGLARLERDVLSKNPRVVIVLLGGNDAIRRLPPTETFANLESIINRIHEKGAGVLLVGVRGGLLGDAYKSEFKALARKTKVSFVPNILEDIFAHTDLMYDSIHPNNRGHLLMADRIEPILRAMIGR